ncbi:MAG: PIG-L family deacetylase [Planctomycetes bacterium]|nr:PIG-L family deacetylase [Planctomycetota bacterium]
MNIAVLAAHPDDAELGLGATMALLVSQGHRVLIIDATNGEPTPHGDPATRAKEAAEAARILGVERVNLGWTNRAVIHDLPSRHALAGQLRLNKIDLMFVPHPLDAHPDHLALCRIGIDARFDAKLTKSALAGDPHHPRRLLHYFCTHLKNIPQPDLIVDCAGFEQKKMRAIAAYKSQFEANPGNRSLPKWVEAMGRFYGSRINSEFGEPITSPECVGVRDLASLLP